MPHSRSMPTIGPGVHELRIADEGTTWRIIYKLESSAILLLHVFQKKTAKTPATVIDICKARLRHYHASQ